MNEEQRREMLADVARDIAAGKAKLAKETKLEPIMQAERSIITSLYHERCKQYPDQTEFAKLIGWTQGNVSRFENRRNKPTLRTVIQYCQALGIELTAVMTKNG